MNDQTLTTQFKQAVLITGASTGIGRACIDSLLKQNFRPIVTYRTAVQLQQFQREYGDRIDVIDLDLLSRYSVSNVASRLAPLLVDRSLYGVVNVAGVNLPGPLECVTGDRLRQQFEVNVFATMDVIRQCLPFLRESGGRVINVGSKLGRVSAPYLGPYCGSKAALIALNDALRMELAPQGIAVSVVDPGAVRTPIWLKTTAEAKQYWHTVPNAIAKLYDKTVQAMLKQAAVIGEGGISPEQVADTIAKALCANKPKPRYLVGFDTKMAVLLASVLPTWLFDRMIVGARQ